MIGGPEINTGTGVRGQVTGTPGGVIGSRSASTFWRESPERQMSDMSDECPISSCRSSGIIDTDLIGYLPYHIESP